MKEKISAFPVFDNDRVGTDYGCHERGMTLRDYFAGQVITGIFSSGKEIQSNGIKIQDANQFAELAYNVADAMLVEREK
jgi:hypothetical protein